MGEGVSCLLLLFLSLPFSPASPLLLLRALCPSSGGFRVCDQVDFWEKLVLPRGENGGFVLRTLLFQVSSRDEPAGFLQSHQNDALQGFSSRNNHSNTSSD